MSLQEVGHQAISWTVAITGGAMFSLAWKSYEIAAMVSESSWDKLAEQVPQMVVMLICFAMFLRALSKLGDRIDANAAGNNAKIDTMANVFGSKFDAVEEAVSKLREKNAIDAEGHKYICRWQPPTQSWESRQDTPPSEQT